MFELIRTFANDRSGATAMEYGLIAALLATVLLVAMHWLGMHVENIYALVAQGFV